MKIKRIIPLGFIFALVVSSFLIMNFNNVNSRPIDGDPIDPPSNWITGTSSYSYEVLRNYWSDSGRLYEAGGFGFKHKVLEAQYYNGYNDWFRPISSSIYPDLQLDFAWSEGDHSNTIYSQYISVRVYEEGTGWLDASVYLLDGKNYGLITRCDKDLQGGTDLAYIAWSKFISWGLQKTTYGIVTVSPNNDYLIQGKYTDGYSYGEYWWFYRNSLYDPSPRSLQMPKHLINLEFNPTKNYGVVVKFFIRYSADYCAAAQEYAYQKILYFGNNRCYVPGYSSGPGSGPPYPVP